MNIIVTFLATMAIIPLPLHGQIKSVPCTLQFSLALRDELGNVDVGLNADDRKWLEKKALKHYPGICYADQKPNVGVWFYISVSTETQGSATATTNTYPNGDGSSTSHTRVTARPVTYPVYTLKIGRFHDGSLETLRTFQRASATASGGGGAVGGIIGLLNSTHNSEHDIILDALDWIAEMPKDSPSSPKK